MKEIRNLKYNEIRKVAINLKNMIRLRQEAVDKIIDSKKEIVALKKWMQDYEEEIVKAEMDIKEYDEAIEKINQSRKVKPIEVDSEIIKIKEDSMPKIKFGVNKLYQGEQYISGMLVHSQEQGLEIYNEETDVKIEPGKLIEPSVVFLTLKPGTTEEKAKEIQEYLTNNVIEITCL
jgi:hypothetical protein